LLRLGSKKNFPLCISHVTKVMTSYNRRKNFKTHYNSCYDVKILRSVKYKVVKFAFRNTAQNFSARRRIKGLRRIVVQFSCTLNFLNLSPLQSFRFFSRYNFNLIFHFVFLYIFISLKRKKKMQAFNHILKSWLHYFI
jgi:hypothetical protein